MKPIRGILSSSFKWTRPEATDVSRHVRAFRRAHAAVEASISEQLAQQDARPSTVRAIKRGAA